MTISPSIVAAAKRFATSAFAYDEARPRENFDTIGKYARANASAGKTKTPAKTVESIPRNAILAPHTETRSFRTRPRAATAAHVPSSTTNGGKRIRYDE